MLNIIFIHNVTVLYQKLFYLSVVAVTTIMIHCANAHAAFRDGCGVSETTENCMDRLEGYYQLLPSEHFADTNGDGDIDGIDAANFAQIYGFLTWFVDRDQDGLGDPNKVIHLRGQPTHTWLFSRQSGDTNDHGTTLDKDGDGWPWPDDCDDYNFFTHPNAPSRTVARANGSWDWDCSGTVDKDIPALDSKGSLSEEIKENECHTRLVLTKNLECGSTDLAGHLLKGILSWDKQLKKCTFVDTYGALETQPLAVVLGCK